MPEIDTRPVTSEVASVYYFATSGINGWFCELRPGDDLRRDDFGEVPDLHVVPRSLWRAYSEATAAAFQAEKALDDWIETHD